MTRTNPPTYIAYHVPASTAGAQGEARAGWTRVGAAWLHPDGLGFDVVLDVLPLDGRFTLCAPLAETGTLGRGSVRRGDVWYPGDTPPQVPCGEAAGDDGSQR
jgi:hypothetical protein